jgi:hypothetical protein
MLRAWRFIPTPEGKYVPPVIVGCIEYASSVSDQRHTTRFIYEVDRKGPTDNNLWATIDLTAENVPAGEVLLSQNPFLPWDAD